MTLRVKQEPRPAYHRRQDLIRLRSLAHDLPVIVGDLGDRYQVRLLPLGETILFSGRHEVIAAYLTGWRHALGLRELPPQPEVEDEREEREEQQL